VAERLGVGLVLKIVEGLGHAGQAEGAQLIEGRVGEHRLPQWK
jgi:hypothetical protein